MVERISGFWDELSRIQQLDSARLPENWTGRLSPALIYYEAFVKIVWHLQGDPPLFKFLSDNCRGSGLDSIAKNNKFAEFVHCWGNELPNQKRPRFNDDKLKEMRDTLHSFSQELFIVFKPMFQNEKLKENLLEVARKYDKGERVANSEYNWILDVPLGDIAQMIELTAHTVRRILKGTTRHYLTKLFNDHIKHDDQHPGKYKHSPFIEKVLKKAYYNPPKK